MLPRNPFCLFPFPGVSGKIRALNPKIRIKRHSKKQKKKEIQNQSYSKHEPSVIKIIQILERLATTEVIKLLFHSVIS
jgi:hypothetical protein